MPGRRRAARNVAPLAVLSALTLLLPVGGWGWPSAALIVLLVALGGLRGEGGPAPWLRADARIRRVVGRAVAVVSGAALVGWSFLARPISPTSPAIFAGCRSLARLGGGVVWAASTPSARSRFFRGALTEGLGGSPSAGSRARDQAVAFGAAHWHGVPRGVAGVLLATVYGLMLGLLRAKTRGLLAPMLAHVFADLAVLGLRSSSAPATLHPCIT